MIYLTTILLFVDILSAQIKLNYDPPEFVDHPRWPESSYYIQDGPSITLQCDIRAYTDTKLLWYKDANIIKPMSNVYGFGTFNSTMTILLPKQEQSGKYACVATNSAGNISYSGFIFIKEQADEARPRIISTFPEGSKIFAAIDQSINISCTFDVGGSDIALMDLTLEWRRRGLTLNDTNHTAWQLAKAPTNDQTLLLLFDSILEDDYGEYSCYGENVHGNDTRSIFLLPPLKRNSIVRVQDVIVGSALGATFVILALVALFVRRHRLQQKKYERLTWPELDSQYEVPERTIEYDVFISYSSDDLSWVKDVLLCRLENAGYRVCIDYKDFTPGLPIADNILDSIYRSRKTLVLLSRNFLRSVWGQFELQQALHRAVIQRQEVLIVIKYDSSRVPMKLMGKTFLDWTDTTVQPHFWARLNVAIGSPGVYGTDLGVEKSEQGRPFESICDLDQSSKNAYIVSNQTTH
ncbi:interleukin-1 receptor accessory protein-like 1-A [Dreissena polymorpha]|nr:interleukin-1 receptor accessory protein-like 1-A [Dreissena polymorpha]